MRRIATALGLLLLMSGPAFAQKEFEPTAAERRTIGECIDKTAGDSELEQMSKVHWPCGRPLSFCNCPALADFAPGAPSIRTAITPTNISFDWVISVSLPRRAHSIPRRMRHLTRGSSSGRWLGPSSAERGKKTWGAER